MMEKLLIIGSLLVVLSGCESINTPVPITPVSPTPSSPITSETPTPTAIVGQIYRNDAYNFELTYPQEFGFVTPNYANLENKVVQLQIGAEAYPKTNFGEAAVAISTEFAKTPEECQNLSQPEGSAGFKETVDIKGVTFDTTSGSGAGAGNLYESRIYRRLHGSFCYEITETIHTSNIDNYDAGTVTEIDKDLIWNKLDIVTKTFKFLD